METVAIHGVRYACPFAALFPALSDDESSYLRQSISELGIRNPVLTYDSPTLGPALIQGRNRCWFSEQLGIPLPHTHLGPLPDDTARRIAYDVQAAGRMLSPGQVEQARRDRVKVLATEGYSRRLIADLTGLPKSTVHDTISSNEDSGVRTRTPEPECDSRAASSTVQGRDGKQYRQAPKVKLPDAADLEAFAVECVKRAGVLLDRLETEIESILSGPLAAKFKDGAKAKKQPVPTMVEKWFPLALVRYALNCTQ